MTIILIWPFDMNSKEMLLIIKTIIAGSASRG